MLSAARLTLATSSTFSVRLDAASVSGETPKPITGSGVFDYATGQGQAHLVQPTGLERILFLPAALFEAQPNPTLPPGKLWISADLAEQSSATTVPQFVTQVEGLNPGLVLAELLWGAQSAAPIAATMHLHGYAVQVDLEKARAQAAGSSAAALRRAIGYQLSEMSGASAPTQVTVDVGIDRQGRIALLRSSPPGAGTGTVTLSLAQFGAPVTVAPPAAAQVADIASLTPTGEGDPDGT